MNYEQQYFLRILSDHLSARKTEPILELDWSFIADLSRAHQVEGIVYFQCRGFMPNDISERLGKAFDATVYSYANRKAIMNNVINEMKDNCIFMFLVKGLRVSTHYPIPALRTMSDCDIVVHRKDIAFVHRLLKKMGFESKGNASLEQCGFDKNGMHFEVHDRLVQEGEYATNRQVAFFNNYDYYVNDGEVDPSFHFLFLLMHLRKHFLNHGVGIRQFMDLAAEIQRNEGLNWQWIEERLVFLELSRFAHVCYSLIKVWFGIEAPVDCMMLDKQFAKQVTEKIMSDGVFGFDNELNYNVDAYTALVLARGPMWFRRLSVIWRKVFLSYEIMRGYEDCRFVDGKPWLMPMAWARRFIGIVARKDNTRTVSVIKNSLLSKKELNTRIELLKKMGLL